MRLPREGPAEVGGVAAGFGSTGSSRGAVRISKEARGVLGVFIRSGR